MNAQVRKVLDTLPSYMVAEWALPALINGDYTGIIPTESCGEAAMVAQFDEEVVQGRSIIVDKEEEEEDGTISPVFCKDEITGTFTECVRIWLV